LKERNTKNSLAGEPIDQAGRAGLQHSLNYWCVLAKSLRVRGCYFILLGQDNVHRPASSNRLDASLAFVDNRLASDRSIVFCAITNGQVAYHLNASGAVRRLRDAIASYLDSHSRISSDGIYHDDGWQCLRVCLDPSLTTSL